MVVQREEEGEGAEQAAILSWATELQNAHYFLIESLKATMNLTDVWEGLLQRDIQMHKDKLHKCGIF